MVQYICHVKLIKRNSVTLETVQDFLIKLGNKPHMHMLEVSVFSLNHLTVQTYQNYEPPQRSQYFQSHFSASKLKGISLIFFSVKNIRPGDQLLKVKFFENFDFNSTLFSKHVPNFCRPSS